MLRQLILMICGIFMTMNAVAGPSVHWGIGRWGSLVYTDGRTMPVNHWTVGSVILPPEGADPLIKPNLGGLSDHFYWDNSQGKLYALRPFDSVVIYWKAKEGNFSISSQGQGVWPERIQRHVTETSSVNLLGAESPYYQVVLGYSETQARVESGQFINTQTGKNVLIYFPKVLSQALVFEVVETVDWHQVLTQESLDIGVRISDRDHHPLCKNGFLYHPQGPHIPNTQSQGPYDGYVAENREGFLVAANEDLTPDDPKDDLVVAWYSRGNDSKVCWPSKVVHYQPQWPTYSAKMVIASGLGSGVFDPSVFGELSVYFQNDRLKAGYNPNEEHALVYPGLSQSGTAVFSLRNDLNTSLTSKPYVLVKYRHVPSGEWGYQAYEVVQEDETHRLDGFAVAGQRIQPPYPLSDFEGCVESKGVSGPYWKDYHHQFWAKSAGISGEVVSIEMQFYERWKGTCVPWLSGTSTIPKTLSYSVKWPEETPELKRGETLITAKNGLPTILNQCSVEVLYDESSTGFEGTSGVRLLEFLHEISVQLETLPSEIEVASVLGKESMIKLPPSLRRRIFYDPLQRKIKLKGIYDTSFVGDPLVLPNILSLSERDQLLGLSPNASFQGAVQNLYHQSHQGIGTQKKWVGGSKALSAGWAQREGYVTLVFQADATACPSLPISMSVIRVVPKLYTGSVQVIASDNVLDEKLTLRHNGDFGGEPEHAEFEWRYYPDEMGIPPFYDPEGENFQWVPFDSESMAGMNAITIEGSGTRTLRDKWFIVRYREQGPEGDHWSRWTEPQLYEGWIKRAVRGLNPFEEQNRDQGEASARSYGSMIQQMGTPYRGNVALNTSSVSGAPVGLIELYQTILNQGKSLSIEGVPPVNDPLTNNTLLLVAGRLADFYMLLGNEAFADAQDPTIGVLTSDGEYGVQATRLFSFQNQVPSLLDEELALLRGRDDKGSSTKVFPLYNRLAWNFTSGIDGGEVAYSLNYHINQG